MQCFYVTTNTTKNNMDTVTIKKSELKSLIQETLKEYFPKYNFVSDKEQAEIESIYKNDEFNKQIKEDDFVEL